MLDLNDLLDVGCRMITTDSISAPILIVQREDGPEVVRWDQSPESLYQLGSNAAKALELKVSIRQVAVMVAGWTEPSKAGHDEVSNETRPQDLLIVSSWVPGGAPEHIACRLQHQGDDCVVFDKLEPYKIVSPVLDQFISGYNDGLPRQRTREKDRELDY